MSAFRFEIQKRQSGGLARVGIIHTPHGAIETPTFVVVGTKAAVKALTPEQVRSLGAHAVLANTYHLYLQPGDEVVRESGGLSEFMNWNGPTMTDSGGFQVYSLGSAYSKDYNKFISKGELGALVTGEVTLRANREQLMRVSEEGASFRSHLDGSKHTLTPEGSIRIQHNIGADIIFALDECTAPMDSYEYQKEAMERTHRWAERSLAEHTRRGRDNGQALFGIVQGGVNEDLRKISARTVASMDFDGFGIGGSYTKEDMEDTLKWVNPILPEEKPRHLLGIGEPRQLFMGIERGVDTFDCVAPTREGRNGSLYTRRGRINILNARFATDRRPVEEGCSCYTCRNFTRSYLAHLYRAKELLALTLGSIHNLFFIVNLVKDARQSILDERFSEFRDEFFRAYR